jgi:hypothetical protein
MSTHKVGAMKAAFDLEWTSVDGYSAPWISWSRIPWIPHAAVPSEATGSQSANDSGMNPRTRLHRSQDTPEFSFEPRAVQFDSQCDSQICTRCWRRCGTTFIR